MWDLRAHECTLQGSTCKSKTGFVFDQGTFRELVDVPASEEQKKKGIKSSGVKYHSLWSRRVRLEFSAVVLAFVDSTKDGMFCGICWQKNITAVHPVQVHFQVD